MNTKISKIHETTYVVKTLDKYTIEIVQLQKGLTKEFHLEVRKGKNSYRVFENNRREIIFKAMFVNLSVHDYIGSHRDYLRVILAYCRTLYYVRFNTYLMNCMSTYDFRVTYKDLVDTGQLRLSGVVIDLMDLRDLVNTDVNYDELKDFVGETTNE